jgi:anti-anti-sigma regulatory factor
MVISTTSNDTGRTLLIKTDQILDLETFSMFSNAALVASYPWINDIEIDLRSTTTIRDSGLSMLLMLSKKSGMKKPQIRLLNCSPEIRDQLTRHRLDNRLEVA